MAKRKRLSPAQPGYLEGARAPETKSMPVAGRPGVLGPDPVSGPVSGSVLGPAAAPIAQVAGDAAAHAALEELSTALRDARGEGRLIEALPLDSVDAGYLVRDRMEQDEDEMGALMDSLRARGQQTAAEVIRLPDRGGRGPAYGLISGWRRLVALRRLHSQTGEDRFATLRARVIAPETASDAYVAMVEENEIRVNLSFYERARIAVHAMREGVYPTQRAALQGLFGATTRSRRSKIGSFIAVVEAFDGDLVHPTAISEKLGLALAREIMRDPEFVSEVRVRLESAPQRSAGEEMRLLAAAIAARQPARQPAPAPSPGADAAPA
ncbi:MAG: ParB N-terminal domain-containing protein, partial [Rhodobacteraceae bacterium]|nr:ParB N-terminal domain-containing protein [Paracoccaceae bacterium]